MCRWRRLLLTAEVKQEVPHLQSWLLQGQVPTRGHQDGHEHPWDAASLLLDPPWGSSWCQLLSGLTQHSAALALLESKGLWLTHPLPGFKTVLVFWLYLKEAEGELRSFSSGDGALQA